MQQRTKLQAKYGYAKDKANQEVDDWCNRAKWVVFRNSLLSPVAASCSAGLFCHPSYVQRMSGSGRVSRAPP